MYSNRIQKDYNYGPTDDLNVLLPFEGEVPCLNDR